MAITERAVQDHPTLSMATLCEAFQWTAAQRPDAIAITAFGGGLELTWGEYAERVRQLAGGLAALGVKPGDTVGIMLRNRPEFYLIDAAALHLGATPFSVYNTSSAEQIDHLFGNAGNRIVFTEPELAPAVEGKCEKVILIDELPAIEALEPPAGFDFEAAWRAVGPDTLATLIYTSGTTGPPKGVQLDHRALMAECRGTSAFLPVTPGGRVISFLPSAHIADRWVSYYHSLISYGFTVYSLADPSQLVAALAEVRPTLFGAVPRVWEKIEAALRAQGIEDTEALPTEVKAGVRAKLGLDQAERFVCGASPIPPETLRFFIGLDIRAQEVWGLSETSACLTVAPAEDPRIGTCGVAIPGVELKLADDGEVLARGDVVMAGYRNDPQLTAAAFDADGWFLTGDIGRFDADGYLTIVDRKKELIITQGGKNISPANIENKLKAAHPLLGQAIAIGDRRPYISALLVLDPEVCAARGETPAKLASDPAVVAELAAAVEAVNQSLSRPEQVKRFEVLADEWLPDGDELTPTMKLKRKPIAAKYAEQIEALYA